MIRGGSIMHDDFRCKTGMKTRVRTGRKTGMLRVAAAAVAAALLSGCAEGLDLEVNAPILEAVGLNLTSKPRQEPELADRPPLVVPPSNRLPEPGQPSGAQGQNQGWAAQSDWPDDPDERKKQMVAADARKKEEDCRDNKAVDPEVRCKSKLGEAISKTFKRDSQNTKVDGGE